MPSPPSTDAASVVFRGGGFGDADVSMHKDGVALEPAKQPAVQPASQSFRPPASMPLTAPGKDLSAARTSRCGSERLHALGNRNGSSLQAFKSITHFGSNAVSPLGQKNTRDL